MLLLSWIQVRLFGFYGKCYFQKAVFVNLSQRVWIIFRLNFKTFFWQYMLSLYLPLQILLSDVFLKESSIWFAILVVGLRIISPRPRHYEQTCLECLERVCSIVSGLLFSFPEKFAQGPTPSCWWDVCGPYFWHLQCFWNCRLWLAVLTVLTSGKDVRYGFEISREYRRLAFVFSPFVKLIWFCETAKLSKSVLSNFKRMT